MDINQLSLMSDDQINYNSLPEDVLKELALGDEPFIATSALVELRIRKSQQAPLVAKEILFQSRCDRYLQSAALSVLFDTDREQAMNFIQQQLHRFDGYMLNTLMSIILENASDLDYQVALEIGQTIIERFKEFNEQSKFPDPEVKRAFLGYYASLAAKIAV